MEAKVEYFTMVNKIKFNINKRCIINETKDLVSLIKLPNYPLTEQFGNPSSLHQEGKEALRERERQGDGLRSQLPALLHHEASQPKLQSRVAGEDHLDRLHRDPEGSRGAVT